MPKALLKDRELPVATCLVVDDSSLMRMLANKMLADMGIRTCEATNGTAAYDMCAIFLPDVVLLDWRVAELDGGVFLRKLRAGQLARQPKVIFCISEREGPEVVRALEEGVDDYILQPYDDAALLSKMRLVGVL